VDRQELERRLSAAPLFAGIAPSLRVRLAQAAIVTSHRADDALWREGDPADAFVVIQHGLVAIRRATPGVEDALIGIFGPREAIGISAALERGRFPADAIAITDEVEVLRVQAKPVLEALPHDPVLAMSVNRSLLEHTHALRTKIDVLSAGPVSRRLAALFHHLADRFGDEDATGALDVPLAISRVRLARLVGARGETVMRTLATWRRRGLLREDPGGFHFSSRSALESLLSGR
jgi:CRP-like cAMP-binding protein